MRFSVSDTGREQYSRAEAQRRFSNLILYRIRPILADRTRSDADRVILMKRVYREANLIRAQGLVPAGMGTREELLDLLTPMLQPGSPASEELQDWIKRVFRAFGAYYEGADFE